MRKSAQVLASIMASRSYLHQTALAGFLNRPLDTSPLQSLSITTALWRNSSSPSPIAAVKPRQADHRRTGPSAGQYRDVKSWLYPVAPLGRVWSLRETPKSYWPPFSPRQLSQLIARESAKRSRGPLAGPVARSLAGVAKAALWGLARDRRIASTPILGRQRFLAVAVAGRSSHQGSLPRVGRLTTRPFCTRRGARKLRRPRIHLHDLREADPPGPSVFCR